MSPSTSDEPAEWQHPPAEATVTLTDITAGLLHDASEIWSDNWCIPSTAPHPVAAHAWINWLLTPSTAVTEMNYHNYKIPMQSALDQLPGALRKRAQTWRGRRCHLS